MWDAERAEGRPVARVLLDSALPQLDHLFDYAIPAELASEICVGHRVRVPFRSQGRRSYGYVVSFAERSEFAGELHSISEIVGTVPMLNAAVWRLARALADRAGGSASDILRLAIPQRNARAEQQYLAASSMLGGQGSIAACDPTPADAETARLLIAGERLALTPHHGLERLSTGEWVGNWAAQLARIALAVFAAGRSVILAAPDYRDTEQLAAALAAYGHDAVVRVDARQSASSRYRSFLRALDPTLCIVLGNRSAVYAPVHRLGAIVLWDDGDPLLAEPHAPYVHARDAALVRAVTEYQQQGTVPEHAGGGDTSGEGEAMRLGLLFAAHSCSLEVQRLIDIGYLLGEQQQPRRTRVIAAQAVQDTEVIRGRVPEFAAREIRAGLKHGPVLVQVAAPGYAVAAVCRSCGVRARCAACAGPLSFPRAGHAVCRWCGQHAAAWRCAECECTEIEFRGAGAARTVAEFERQFPGVRIILSDGEHPHTRVDSRPALIVATRGAEPIASGGYRAVVLLDAERLLAIESLRVGEDCLRWWLGAAALAAPDARLVLASGAGPVVQALVTGRLDDWRRHELADRRQLRYPPAVRVASVTGGAREVERALAELGELPGVDVLGPAPYQPSQRGEVVQEPVALVRAIVRFDYAQGAEVARRLRGALVADAAGSNSRVAGRSQKRARAAALRLRFDDRGVFDG